MAHTIVDNDEILDLHQMREERWNLHMLGTHINDLDEVLKWCVRRRLLRNSVTCNRCNVLCTLVSYGLGDRKRWYCRLCCNTKSVRHGSFFSLSKLSIKKIIILMYCWAHNLSQMYTNLESDVHPNRIVDWFNYIRIECGRFLQRIPRQIGGFNENGQQIVVEIDESKFTRRKYHRGRWFKGHWVFSGVERDSGKCFLVEVANRRVETLIPIIQDYILPGTHIMTDGHASYANVSTIANGIYSHSVVIHRRNFLNPEDIDVHTQSVENMWMRAKRRLRAQFGTSDELFPSYLQEFMYRNYHRRENCFAMFLITIAENYPLQ